jgi:hypothetical protein
VSYPPACLVGRFGAADRLLFRSRQAPVAMGFGTRLSGAKLTFLSRLGATCGAPHRQCLFLSDFHGCIMQRCRQQKWSILTSLFDIRTGILACYESPFLVSFRKRERGSLS